MVVIGVREASEVFIMYQVLRYWAFKYFNPNLTQESYGLQI